MSEVRNSALAVKLLLLRLGTGPLSMSSLPFMINVINALRVFLQYCKRHALTVYYTAKSPALATGFALFDLFFTL